MLSEAQVGLPFAIPFISFYNSLKIFCLRKSIGQARAYFEEHGKVRISSMNFLFNCYLLFFFILYKISHNIYCLYLTQYIFQNPTKGWITPTKPKSRTRITPRGCPYPRPSNRPSAGNRNCTKIQKYFGSLTRMHSRQVKSFANGLRH